LPAVPKWSDFDDCHGKDCVFVESTLSVHLNMNQLNNGHELSTTDDARPRYTGERLLRERPKVYRQVVRLLGEGWSANKICKWCHVTRETVRAVERREATEISARKKSIVGILSNVAELGAGRMEETIGKAGLRDAAIGTGIAVDKMLALTGQMPSINRKHPDADSRGTRRASGVGRQAGCHRGEAQGRLEHAIAFIKRS
jgi:hypothetical protein